MAYTHIYLRASTKDQDENRARQMLEQFAADKGLKVAGVYAENYSGTKLDRPELAKLLASARDGDIILCESVDRLSRLSQKDWASLKAVINDKGLRLVVADLPTTHQVMTDDIGGAILKVISDMLVDLMATMARLDQQKRVERIQQGLDKKRAEGWKPSGRVPNTKKHTLVRAMLSVPTEQRKTADEIAHHCGVGVATVYRIKAAMASE